MIGKRKKSLYQAYLISAVIGLVIIGILYKFTLPQIEQMMEVRRNLKSEKDRLERLIKKAKQLEALDAETLRNDFLVLQKALPSEKDVAGILFSMDRLKTEATISLTKLQVNPGLVSTPSATPSAVATSTAEKKDEKKEKAAQALKKEAPSAVSFLKFDLSLAGSFSPLRTFLEKIKKISPLLGVSSLKFSVKEKVEKEGEETEEKVATASPLRIDLKMFSHYQLLPPFFLGKVDDSPPVLTNKDQEILEETSRLPVYSEPPPTATGAALGKPNPFE